MCMLRFLFMKCIPIYPERIINRKVKVNNPLAASREDSYADVLIVQSWFIEILKETFYSHSALMIGYLKFLVPLFYFE
jgi:hypothetical protein